MLISRRGICSLATPSCILSQKILSRIVDYQIHATREARTTRGAPNVFVSPNLEILNSSLTAPVQTGLNFEGSVLKGNFCC